MENNSGVSKTGGEWSLVTLGGLSFRERTTVQLVYLYTVYRPISLIRNNLNKKENIMKRRGQYNELKMKGICKN